MHKSGCYVLPCVRLSLRYSSSRTTTVSSSLQKLVLTAVDFEFLKWTVWRSRGRSSFYEGHCRRVVLWARVLQKMFPHNNSKTNYKYQIHSFSIRPNTLSQYWCMLLGPQTNRTSQHRFHVCGHDIGSIDGRLRVLLEARHESGRAVCWGGNGPISSK